ncbi:MULTISPECIES: SBBP repeat-containing protein [Pseudanabaena]|uniref:Peptidase domain protein n=2 Tax=Pseudanabaena TaxID=1152 RepID=L8MX77_9CYAN|nr:MULTISPECIES: SBBP repeat-containing protein [Pseudanabaena]ELS31399.1 peptidase domain protein [Pseudanabaena biceps PCC 7429]MDG3496344.1 SBBP repeat-containing protein [Pseudanabaena catenata USMAC16]
MSSNNLQSNSGKNLDNSGKSRKSKIKIRILEPRLTPSGLFDSGDLQVPVLTDLLTDHHVGNSLDTSHDLSHPTDVVNVPNTTPVETPVHTEVAPLVETVQILSAIAPPTALVANFDSGVFTVGETGKISIDFLHDGGGYQGQLAIFSLTGMESLDPNSTEFIHEAATRALSNSNLGHILIDDITNGAHFASGDNSGQYLGEQTFTMQAGDRFGMMLVPNGTVQTVAGHPDIGGDLRPLFSMATANPNDAYHVGQITDVYGDGKTFVFEDLRVDHVSDGDFNDLVFHLKGATGQAATFDQLLADGTMSPAQDWRNGDLGHQISEYIPPSNQPLIGIIDTGFAAHNPDINYSNITLGHDYIGHDADPLLQAGEGSEHGTHILGIIGATQDNGIGIDGINDQAPIWLGRAVGSGEWANSLTEFVNHSVASGHDNAVVNLSLDLTQVNADGSVTTRYEFTPQERAALELARQHHVLIVAAAGNDGGVMSVLGQASQEFDNIITVGAADGLGRADYSNYGYGLDILADGGTIADPMLSTVGDGVGTMAGTSVATAEVTGAISKIWAANPDLSYRQVIGIVKQSAIDLDTPGWDMQTGAGLLNLAGAIALATSTKGEVYDPLSFSIPTTWGGEGKVTPEERAANGGQSIGLEWIRQFGTAGNDIATSIAVDAAGNLYVSGRTIGGGNGDTSWVAKYDKNGVQQWIKNLGFSSANSITVDPLGINVYVAGDTGSAAWLGRLDSNQGDIYWIERLQNNFQTSGLGVAVDKNSNPYITGRTLGSLGGVNQGGPDAWVAKYSLTGQQLWVKQLGTTNYDESWGVGVDGTGNVYLAGGTNGTLAGVNSGYTDAWIAKYDGNGNRVWVRQLGTSSNEDARNIVVDQQGNSYVVGITNGALGGSNTNGFPDAWLAKYDTNGSKLWTRQLGTAWQEDGLGISLDNTGNVYITGDTYNALGSTAGLAGTNAGLNDAFVAKYDNSGNIQWVKQIGTSAEDISQDVVVDSAGNIYIAGRTTGSLEGTQRGLGDAFIAKFGVTPTDDSLATARNLGDILGSQTVANFVGDADLQDYYRFNVSVASDLKVLLNGLSADANLELLDSNGISLFKSQSTGNNSELITTPLNQGAYYLRVYSGGTGANTNYTMNITGTPIAPPDTVGDDINNALNIGNLDGTRIFNEFVGDTDPYDYYRFTLNKDSQFSLVLNGVSATGSVANPNVNMFKLNSDGTFYPFSGSNVVNGSNTINDLFLAGTYIVRVGDNVSALINSNYNLTLTAKVFDAGNTPATARNIGNLIGTGSQAFKDEIGNGDPQDYYRFYVPSGTDVKFDLSGLNSPTDVQVLKDVGGTLVPVQTLTGQQNIADLALRLSTGTYYLRVAPTASTDSTSYDLNVSWASREPKDLKINFDSTYGSGKDIYITGKVFDPDGFGDLDKILLTVLQQGGTSKDYTITNFTPSATDPRWAEFSYNLGRLAPGNYAYNAAAYDKSGGTSGRNITIGGYPVTVVYTPEDTAGDIPAQARNLGVLNGILTASDYVGTTDPNDYYRFTVPPTTHFTGLTNVKINLNGMSGDADLSLYQLRSDGSMGWVPGWSTSQSSTMSESIDTMLNSGDYLISVTSGGIKLVPASPNTTYNLTIASPTVSTIALNQSVSGVFDSASARQAFDGNTYAYQNYILTGATAGQNIKISLDANGFAPQLAVVDVKTGIQRYLSSAGNTSLEFTVPSDWDYQIQVTSPTPNAIGSYILSTAIATKNNDNPSGTFVVGTDANGNVFPAFAEAINYYGISGVPTSEVYRAGNGYIQEFYGTDGAGKYYMMFEDGASTAFLLGGDLLDYYLNNGGVGRFGYPISEVKPDPKSSFSTQYFRKGSLVIHNGQVYGYDGTPPIAGTPIPNPSTPTQTGRVNTTSGVFFRSQPSGTAPKLQNNVVPFNTTFKIIQKVDGGFYANGSRNDWYEIEYNGKRGYVAVAYTDLVSDFTPPSLSDTKIINEVNMSVSTGVDGTLIESTGILISPAYLRSQPWVSDSTGMSVLPAGSEFTVISKVTTDNPNYPTWYKVQINDNSGFSWAYIWDGNIQIDEPFIDNGGLDIIPVSSTTKEFLGTVKKNKFGGVTVRTSNSTTSSKIIKIESGTKLTFSEEKVDEKGIHWFRIKSSSLYKKKKINGRWVSGTEINLEVTPTPTPTPTPSNPVMPSNGLFSEDATDTRQELNELPEFQAMSKLLFGTTHIANGGYLQDYSGIAAPTNYKAFHAGIDIQASYNTPIQALVGGKVINVQTKKGKASDMLGYNDPSASNVFGAIAVYNEALDKTFIYLHMKSSNVNVGDLVEAGQIIGNSGHTGAWKTQIDPVTKEVKKDPVTKEVIYYPVDHFHIEVQNHKSQSPYLNGVPPTGSGTEKKLILKDPIQDAKNAEIIKALIRSRTVNPINAFLEAKAKNQIKAPL